MSGQCNKLARIALHLAQMAALAFHCSVLGLIPPLWPYRIDFRKTSLSDPATIAYHMSTPGIKLGLQWWKASALSNELTGQLWIYETCLK